MVSFPGFAALALRMAHWVPLLQMVALVNKLSGLKGTKRSLKCNDAIFYRIYLAILLLSYV